MYKVFFKRLIDILISLIALIISAIPMIFIIFAVKIDSPGPAFFIQKRLGKDGKIFDMYKFRSMCLNAEYTGSGVYSGSGDIRVTRVGKILRATSLDEIPQFINILKGDMSLIGPRPPLTYHPWNFVEYSEEQKRMFEVRPGLTGWAQVNGRREVEWNQRIKLNVWYVDNVSFLLDMKIIFMTVFKVITSANNSNVGETVKQDVNEDV